MTGWACAILRRLGIAALVLVVGLWPLAAQEAESEAPVTLIADRISLERDGTVLVAEGNVEVFSEGRRLRAPRITYDQEADRLVIEGPIRFSEGPEVVILADAADLSPDLRTGLLESARFILERRLQITAGSARRLDDRFLDMRNAVATTCEICEGSQIPIWQVRAARVIQDDALQRIFFESAQFRVVGVPIFWLPALSIPSPGVERARGFLVPTSFTSSLFGTGVRTPYFLPFGPSADLTLTPYIAQGGRDFTNTLEARYRQVFRRGRLTFEGAVSEDSLDEPSPRAYIFGDANFRLPEQVRLDLRLRLSSDDTYLNDYDYDSTDRLENSVRLTRVQDNSRAEAKATRFISLRPEDVAETLPLLIGDLRFDRRWEAPGPGGFVDLSLIGHAHQRPSDDNIDGRDSAQARGYLRWSTERTAGPGLRFGYDARVIGDVKHIRQDDRFDELQTAVTPGLAFTASLPLRKTARGGGMTVLEPVAQLVWTGDYDIDTPNDDSTQPAFDAGNLLGFQRFPGLDRVEDGLRANLALRWRTITPEGWSLGLTLGRVLRRDDASDLFSPGTGLDGTQSDWLGQIEVDLARGLAVRSLLLVDDDASVTLSETRMRYGGRRLRLSAGYVWQEEDPELNQNEDLSEVVLDVGYNFTERWAADVDLRRDFVDARTVEAELGLTYRTECVQVDLFSDRSFRNTDDAEATVTFGLRVSFAGFGTGQTGVSRCRG